MKRVTHPASLVVALVVVLCCCASSSPASSSASRPSLATDGDDGDANMCVTSGCIITASSFLENVDERSDPCSDFYEFSCGRFSEHTLLTREHPTVDVASIRKEQHLAELKVLLEDTKKLDEPEFAWKVKDFFFACMNTSLEEQSESVADFLHSFGDWPVVEGQWWTGGRRFDWQLLFSRLAAAHGFAAGFASAQRVAHHDQDDHHHHDVIGFVPVGSQVAEMIAKAAESESDFDRANATAAAASLVARWAEALGGDNETTGAEAESAVAFAVTINELKGEDDSASSSPGSYESMSLSELRNRIPQVKWRTFVSSLLGRSVASDETVLVKNVGWMSRMAQLMTRTDKRVVANYMLLEVVFSMYATGVLSGQMARNIREQLAEAKLTPETTDPQPPYVVYCLERTSRFLPDAAAALHARKYFGHPEQKTAIGKMEANIRDEMRKLVTHSKLLGEDTPTLDSLLAPSKLATLVGFHDEYFNDSVIDHIYAQVSFSRKDHVANVLAARKYAVRRHFDLTDEPAHFRRWPISHQLGQTEVFVTANRDLLVVPVSALRGPFYSADRPNYLNYGSLGFGIGRGLASVVHALSKAVAGADGNETTTGSAEDVGSGVGGGSECLSEQAPPFLSNQRVRTLMAKASVVEELIKDSLGLIVARRAYDKWVLRHQKDANSATEPRLPIFRDFSPAQMFWISFANTLCHAYEDEALEKKGSTLIPGKLRVLSAVRNSVDFSRSFACSPDSPMNPSRKCSLL